MPRYRRRRKGEEFIVPLNQPKGKRDPEILAHYWHPQREGAIPPPAAFDAKLKAIDPDLFVCYSPVHERWLLWVKEPRIGRGSDAAAADATQMYCPGWLLLMIWEHSQTKAYLELSDLLFMNVFMISRRRWGNAQIYYDRVMADIRRQQASAEKAYQDDRRTYQKDRRDGWKISSAGAGNKFALYHDGTLLPSPGDLAWREETKAKRLPSADLRQARDEKERAFYGTETP